MGMMKRGELLAGAALLSVVLAAAAVACGGGGDKGAASPSPGTSATPTPDTSATPSAVEEQLKAMVLQPTDLPGFMAVQDSFSTNKEVADTADDPQAELATLTQWGRILGHGVVFSSIAAAGGETAAGGVLTVNSTVSLYESDSGAAASFADAVSTARGIDWQASMPDAKDVRVEEVPPLDIADEMLWLRISGTGLVGEAATEQAFVQDIVLLRVGRARGSIETGSTDSPIVAQAVESIVRHQAANIAAGLR